MECFAFLLAYKTPLLLREFELMYMSSALPAVLAHSGAIQVPAMIMSVVGGLLIYGTIISFSMFFREQEEF